MRKIVAIVLIVATGCGAQGNAPAPHRAVLLLSEPAAADRARMADAFEHWLSDSIHAPGASFRLLYIGGDRGSVRGVFATQIPASWRAPNAVANKAAFMARVRHEFADAVAGHPSAIADLATADSLSDITVMPLLDSRGRPWVWSPTGTTTHVAVVCDASPSAADSACSAGTLTGSYDAWLSGAAGAGSSFRVWLVGTGIGSAARVFEVTTPDLPFADRVAMLLGARRELARVLDHAPHAGSAIAETLSIAIDDLASRRGTRRLFVLSDLRQTTPGQWAFDERIPASKSFLTWLAAERLLPETRGITVRVCGLHFAPAPGHSAFDARQSAELKAVWRDAFTAMHPDSLAIRGECDTETFANIPGVLQ